MIFMEQVGKQAIFISDGSASPRAYLKRLWERQGNWSMFILNIIGDISVLTDKFGRCVGIWINLEQHHTTTTKSFVGKATLGATTGSWIEQLFYQTLITTGELNRASFKPSCTLRETQRNFVNELRVERTCLFLNPTGYFALFQFQLMDRNSI